MNKTILTASFIALTIFSAAESLIQNGNFATPITPWKVISLKDTGAADKPGSRQHSQELAKGARPMLKFLLGNLKGDVSFRNVSLVADQ